MRKQETALARLMYLEGYVSNRPPVALWCFPTGVRSSRASPQVRQLARGFAQPTHGCTE